MSWARLDDKFPEHEKVTELSDRAFRVLVTAICYSSRNLTDGHLKPSVLAAATGGRKTALGELEQAGLMEKNGNGGYQIHDYLDYNPTAEKVKRDREEAARRMREIRATGQ